MNYYLGLLDLQMKQDDENPSIGIILCADKGRVDIELALRESLLQVLNFLFLTNLITKKFPKLQYFCKFGEFLPI
jgi:hypothetical protein